ncbi:hypothetical protein JCM33774_45710 [Actinophytocola sp. KF-1]
MVACSPDASSVKQQNEEMSSPRSSFRKASRAEVAGKKAIEVYLGMWRNMATAARTSDWRSPLLSQFATGTALTTISRGLYTDHQNGLVTLGEPKLSPSVAGAEPQEEPVLVRIADCGDSTNWLKYDAKTRLAADDGPAGRRSISAVVTKEPGGRWMVSDFAVQAVGTC